MFYKVVRILVCEELVFKFGCVDIYLIKKWLVIKLYNVRSLKLKKKSDFLKFVSLTYFLDYFKRFIN